MKRIFSINQNILQILQNKNSQLIIGLNTEDNEKDFCFEMKNKSIDQPIAYCAEESKSENIMSHDKYNIEQKELK